MQIQPKASLRLSSESRRARQAALTSDDTFKGGAPGARSGRLPRRPWLAGVAHLWDEARKREADQA
jgi:hypothetical protein